MTRKNCIETLDIKAVGDSRSADFSAVAALIVVLLLISFYDDRTPIEKEMFIDGELYYIGNIYYPMEEKVPDDEAKIIRKWIKTLTIIDEELVHYPYIEPQIKIVGKEQSVGLRSVSFQSNASYPYSHAYRGEQGVILVYPHIEDSGIQYAYLAMSSDQELELKVNEMRERIFDEKYPNFPSKRK